MIEMKVKVKSVILRLLGDILWLVPTSGTYNFIFFPENYLIPKSTEYALLPLGTAILKTTA